MNPCPKPPAKQPKQRKPIQRTRVRTRRTKARPGRLEGRDLEALRIACFVRDDWRCVACGRLVVWERDRMDSGHMAHIRNKRMWGDSIDNVRTKCGDCHLVIEHCNGGVEKIVPAKDSKGLVSRGRA